MTVNDLLAALATMPDTMPIYGGCCGIQRINMGLAVVNIVAPRVPGNPPETRHTVGSLMGLLIGAQGDNLVCVNSQIASRAYVDRDGSSRFADIWAD